MIIHWIKCGGGAIHIIGPCPYCYDTKDGLLVGSMGNTYKGRVTAECQDCNKTIDYYVDVKEEKIWKLEPLEARGSQALDPKH